MRKRTVLAIVLPILIAAVISAGCNGPTNPSPSPIISPSPSPIISPSPSPTPVSTAQVARVKVDVNGDGVVDERDVRAIDANGDGVIDTDDVKLLMGASNTFFEAHIKPLAEKTGMTWDEKGNKISEGDISRLSPAEASQLRAALHEYQVRSDQIDATLNEISPALKELIHNNPFK